MAKYSDKPAETLSPATEVRRHIDAAPERVWAVLSDGWLYPGWVVGASRMRAVDVGWPAEGTRLHHSFGVWPALIDDHTDSLSATPSRRLELRAHGWPAGAAEVMIDLEAEGTGTLVTMREDAVAGPGRLVPPPARHMFTRVRNHETLRRLAYLAEQRHGGQAGGS